MERGGGSFFFLLGERGPKILHRMGHSIDAIKREDMVLTKKKRFNP